MNITEATKMIRYYSKAAEKTEDTDIWEALRYLRTFILTQRLKLKNKTNDCR